MPERLTTPFEIKDATKMCAIAKSGSNTSVALLYSVSASSTPPNGQHQSNKSLVCPGALSDGPDLAPRAST